MEQVIPKDHPLMVPVFRTIHHTVVAEAAAAEAIDKVDTSAIDKVDTSPTNGSVFMNQHE